MCGSSFCSTSGNSPVLGSAGTRQVWGRMLHSHSCGMDHALLPDSDMQLHDAVKKLAIADCADLSLRNTREPGQVVSQLLQLDGVDHPIKAEGFMLTLLAAALQPAHALCTPAGPLACKDSYAAGQTCYHQPRQCTRLVKARRGHEVPASISMVLSDRGPASSGPSCPAKALLTK